MTDMDPQQQAELLAELGRVLDAVDPGGPTEREIAHASFVWRTVDADLAELVFDSLVDQPELALRGSAGEPRALTFSSQDRSIDIEVGDGRVMGQLHGAESARVELCHPSGESTDLGETDDFGMFTFDAPVSGSFALQCLAVDGTWVLRTDWITL